MSNRRVITASQHRKTSTGLALLCQSFPFWCSLTLSVIVLHSPVRPLHWLNHRCFHPTKISEHPYTTLWRPRNDASFNSRESCQAAVVFVWVFQQLNGKEKNRIKSFYGYRSLPYAVTCSLCAY